MIIVKFNHRTKTSELFNAIVDKMPAQFKFIRGDYNQLSVEIDGVAGSHSVRIADHDFTKSGVKVVIEGSYRYDMRNFSVQMKDNSDDEINKLVVALERYVKRYQKVKKEHEEDVAREQYRDRMFEKHMNELLKKFPTISVPYTYSPETIEYKGHNVVLCRPSVVDGKFLTSLRFGTTYGKQITLDEAMKIIDIIA